MDMRKMACGKVENMSRKLVDRGIDFNLLTMYINETIEGRPVATRQLMNHRGL
jgi:hypothetical protein